MYRVLMIVSSWHLLNFLQDASSAKVRAARARTESRWHAESNTDNRITWLGTKILQHVFFCGACVFNHRFLLQTNFHPIAREDLFIYLFIFASTLGGFFCRTAMQKRSEEAVFFTSSEVRGTQVPRYPGGNGGNGFPFDFDVFGGIQQAEGEALCVCLQLRYKLKRFDSMKS